MERMHERGSLGFARISRQKMLARSLLHRPTGTIELEDRH